MNIVEYANRAVLAIDLAKVLAADLDHCLRAHPLAVFVVPGGTTPGPIFDSLCAAELDWGRVRVMLSDERWVPENHARSNAKLLKERLFVNRAAAATFRPFYKAEETPQTAAPKLSKALAARLPISVLLLGMGADMHTASLFPGAKGLAAMLRPDAPLLVPVCVDGQEPRISFSAAALDGALAKHLVIYGDDKRAALERARELDPQEAPIAAVLKEMTVHWAE